MKKYLILLAAFMAEKLSSIKRIFITIISLLVATIIVNAQVPEWSTSIASILYNNCTTCHHEGGIAPFSLLTYTDAVNNGFSIQADVNVKKMPPWPADPNYNHFWNERVLTDSDLSAINDWVNGGMPSGDLSDAPPVPVYTGASTMQNPDDVIHLPAYTITSDSNVYRTFVIHSNYSEVKFINSYEFIPGDWSIVHHANFQSDTSDVPYLNDLADTLPGYSTPTWNDLSSTVQSFGGWFPGNGIFQLPSNMGLPIQPNSDFVISIHYSPGSMGKTDSAKLYLKFCTLPDSLIRMVYKQVWLFTTPPVLVNGPFILPANEVSTFNEVSFPTSHKSMLGIIPHSHHVCNSWEVQMVNSGDTTNLISIPQWSFDWQYSYMLTKVMEVPSLATIIGEASFDNTSNNPDNPNDPPKTLHEGGQSDQEMMRCSFWLMDYKAGDEDIILDSAFYGLPTSATIFKNQISLEIYPNPAKDVLHIVLQLKTHDVSWKLINSLGRIVKISNRNNIPSGKYVQDVEIGDLPPGMYQFIFQSGSEIEGKKVVVIK